MCQEEQKIELIQMITPLLGIYQIEIQRLTLQGIN